MFNIIDYMSNDDFLGSNADVKTVTDFDYNSFYRAVVISNDDPDHLGRVRICIPALHGNYSEAEALNHYPYAYPACFTGLGNQVGQFYLPPIGSFVFVTFEYSEEHRAIYFGGIPTLPYDGKTQSYGAHVNGGIPREIDSYDIPTEYTGTQAIIYKSVSGAVFYIDDNDKRNQVVIKDSKGKSLKFVTNTTEQGWVQYIQLYYDENNSIRFSDNEISITIGGETFTYDKDSMPGGGPSGTVDYQELINKPQINGVTLNGNKTAAQLGLQTTIEFATNADIDAVISLD